MTKIKVSNLDQLIDLIPRIGKITIIVHDLSLKTKKLELELELDRKSNAK